MRIGIRTKAGAIHMTMNASVKTMDALVTTIDAHARITGTPPVTWALPMIMAPVSPSIQHGGVLKRAGKAGSRTQ